MDRTRLYFVGVELSFIRFAKGSVPPIEARNKSVKILHITELYLVLHSKLATSSVLPEPLYFAICG